MEAGSEHAKVGSWSTFSFVSVSMILVAIIVAISMYRIDNSVEKSMVRVANDTGLPLQNVHIGSTGSIYFGDIPVDGMSRYQALTPAYRYAYFRLEVEGKKFETVPEDYVGETPLGRGIFTYRIRRYYHNGEMDFDMEDATRDRGFE